MEVFGEWKERLCWMMRFWRLRGGSPCILFVYFPLFNYFNGILNYFRNVEVPIGFDRNEGI